MCLSTVYRIKNASAGVQPEKEFICRNVADVSFLEDKIYFTDIMGIRTECTGKIEKIDLMENEILIR